MDFSDVVGFLVTISAIFYMFIKKSQDSKRIRSRTTHDDHNEDSSHTLESFLKSLEDDMDSTKNFKKPPEHVKPAPKPIYKPMPSSKTMRDDFTFKTNIEDRKLDISINHKPEKISGDHLLSAEFRGGHTQHVLIGYKRPSRIQNIIHSLPSKKDMILLNEVLSPPKGMR